MKIHFDADMKSVHKRLAARDDIRLKPDEWKAFIEILEKPAEPNENIRRLLTEPSVLER
jgi:uncharacterized protein (DUF1778 family)